VASTASVATAVAAPGPAVVAGPIDDTAAGLLPPQTWTRSPVAPWSRWAARSLDIMLLGMVGTFVVELILRLTLNLGIEDLVSFNFVHGLVVMLIAAVLAALVYGFSGTTPGKFCFGIRVVAPEGGTIGFLRAIIRELDVLVRGLGLGVPVVALITQLVAYRTLTSQGVSSWDGRHSVVLYRASGTTRTVLAIVGIILLLASTAAVVALNRLDA
jgi:uncharacterized RDD family membrane protein YckC